MNTRSVLECGDSSPLSAFHRSRRSERRTEQTGACLFLGFLRCLLFTGFCPPGWGQSYSIDWSTIDGGSGTSTGGGYSVSGSIGQPDAGKMSGGIFTLDGGFWSECAYQTNGPACYRVESPPTGSRFYRLNKP